MEAGIAEERAREAAEEKAYQDALALIESKGIDGAREFFAANRKNHEALCGLIGAMRDSDLVEESNAVVRYNNARR